MGRSIRRNTYAANKEGENNGDKVEAADKKKSGGKKVRMA